MIKDTNTINNFYIGISEKKEITVSKIDRNGNVSSIKFSSDELNHFIEKLQYINRKIKEGK